MNNKVKEDLLKYKIVAIVRNVDYSKIDMLFEALYKGDIKFAEVTLNSENAFRSISELSKKYEGKMYIGAGTVLNIENAKEAVHNGAQFIVTPNTDTEVIKYCVQNNILILPGAMTPTEVVVCINSGAEFVKIFPSSSLGSKYIKELRGPLNNVHMIPVGGITSENMDEFLKCGASGFGIGSNLCNLELINDGKFEEITEIAKKYTHRFLI